MPRSRRRGRRIRRAADPAAAAGGPPAAAGLGTSPQRAYDAALSDYWGSDYDLAISGFEAYLTTFPKSERADDAQFYIGQSYYNQGKYTEAARRVRPDDPHLSEAAICCPTPTTRWASRTGTSNSWTAPAAPISSWSSYPDSAAAAQAEQRLQEVK